jgi:hypothetical protein
MAAPRNLKKMAFQDANLMKLQENIHLAIDPLTGSHIVQGNLVKNITINTSPTTISHGLEDAPVGWIIIRKRGAADIWDLQETNPLEKKLLILQASNQVTVDLWVF